MLIEWNNPLIDDENISTETTWSSEKIFIETAENYAIFEGVIGDSYYSTIIDEEDITNVPSSLYGSWTLDTVTSNGDIESILSNYNNATTKRVISLSDILSINDISDTSISLEDTTKNSGGQPYKFILVWENNSKELGGKVYTSLAELGLDTTATINDIIGVMEDGSQFAYKTDVFDYATEYNNIQYGTVTIHKQSDGRAQVLMIDKNTGNLYVGRMDSTNKIIGWRNESFHRVVAQATAGYFKFKPTNDGGFDQPLRIAVTDNYGGMIEISGSAPSQDQYKPFKCVRLSNGTYASYDAANTTNNKMKKLYLYDGYMYLQVETYTTVTFTGLIEAPTFVETLADTSTEIPIISLINPSIKAAAGSNINSVGTPSVTASESNGTTTFTFNYLKGAKGDTGANGTTPTIKAAAGSNINAVGTPSVTASTSGTTTTFTFNNLKGATGSNGKNGNDGTRGSTWYSGVGITGTSTNPAVFSTSGVSSAVVGDMYLNTTFQNVYRCTTAGNASTAKWVYVCCIKGAKGDTGATGATGATGSKGATGAQGPQGPAPLIHVNGMGGGERTMAELGPQEGIIAICTNVSGGSFFTSVTDGTVKCNGSSFTSGKTPTAGTSYVIVNSSATSSARIYCKNNGGSAWTIMGDVL
jgi:hypothetical protein